MLNAEEFMHHALAKRTEQNLLRKLSQPQKDSIDFSSNDYLGLARDKNLAVLAKQIFHEYYPSSHTQAHNGSSGSRLLSGNFPLMEDCEKKVAHFHRAPSALFYNSGYDANLGLLSAVASRTDVVVYDQWIHASLRDGISLSKAQNFSYTHNDLQAARKKLSLAAQYIAQNKSKGKIFLLTESVFSMDGDTPDFASLIPLCEEFSAALIVDEAHAGGIFEQGRGMLCKHDWHTKVFARVITYGKAAGLHGAAVLGSSTLKEFLINFSRPFIYTTAPTPRHLSYILAYYRWLESTQAHERQKKLFGNIDFFNETQKKINFPAHTYWIPSASAIHSFVIPGNQHARAAALFLQENNFSLFPLLSPTVKAGSERLRICLHSYNMQNEIENFFRTLNSFFTEGDS